MPDRLNILLIAADQSIFSSRECELSEPDHDNPLPQNKRVSHATLYPEGEWPKHN